MEINTRAIWRGKRKEIQLINDCGAIFNNCDLENAIRWYAKTPVARIKHVYLHGNYPAVSVGKEKIHIHRLLMMYWLKSSIPHDFYVHHLDENKLNADKVNLSVIHCLPHQSCHNKGKVLTAQHRERIGVANTRRKGIRHKYARKDITAECVYNLVQKGNSFNAISKMSKIDWSCVKQRYYDFVHDNPELVGGAE